MHDNKSISSHHLADQSIEKKTLDAPARCFPAGIGQIFDLQSICETVKTSARHF